MYKDPGDPAGWFMALVGAVIVLFIYSRVIAWGRKHYLSAFASDRKSLRHNESYGKNGQKLAVMR